MGRGTREKIMDLAIDMFNEKGATNVSTVQLSNEMHISPGNLYYYFDNKEHLIRSIWLEMLTPKIEEFFSQKNLAASEEGLMEFFLQLSRVTYDYRFFYLELSAMLINDPQLRRLYREHADKLMQRIDETMQAWTENGIMRPTESVAKKMLIQNCWTLSQTSITYVTLLDYSTSAKEACDNIIQHLYALLRPYFSDKSHAKMQQLFAENNLDFQKYVQ